VRGWPFAGARARSPPSVARGRGPPRQALARPASETPYHPRTSGAWRGRDAREAASLRGARLLGRYNFASHARRARFLPAGKGGAELPSIAPSLPWEAECNGQRTRLGGWLRARKEGNRACGAAFFLGHRRARERERRESTDLNRGINLLLRFRGCPAVARPSPFHAALHTPPRARLRREIPHTSVHHRARERDSDFHFV